MWWGAGVARWGLGRHYHRRLALATAYVYGRQAAAFKPNASFHYEAFAPLASVD